MVSSQLVAEVKKRPDPAERNEGTRITKHVIIKLEDPAPSFYVHEYVQDAEGFAGYRKVTWLNDLRQFPTTRPQAVWAVYVFL